MSTIDGKLKSLNDGRIASLAADHFGEIIDEMKKRKMTELSQNFRSGKIDQSILLASVSGFCALEDLEHEIKRRILRGEKASHDINKEQMK